MSISNLFCSATSIFKRFFNNAWTETTGEQMSAVPQPPFHSEQDYLSTLLQDRDALPLRPSIAALVDREIAMVRSRMSAKGDSGAEHSCGDSDEVSTVSAAKELVAIDRFAPREVLENIAGFLSSKDFNSLSRVSRTAHWKVASIKQKPKVDVKLSYVREDYQINEKFLYQVMVKHPNGIRYFSAELCHEKKDDNDESTENEDEESEVLTLSKEEMEQEVNGFFWRNRENPLGWDNAETKFKWGIETAIQSHIKFLQENSAKLETIILDDLSASQLAALVSQLEKRPIEVKGIRILWCQYGSNHVVDLLNHCNPNALEVDGISWDQPGSFFELPPVQKVATLKLGSDGYGALRSGSPLSNEQLLLLNAITIDIHDETNVTPAGCRSFILEWAEGKRQVVSVRLRRNATPVSDERWKDVLEGLHDPRLVGITNGKGKFSTTLIRVADGAKLLVEWKHGYISLKSC